LAAGNNPGERERRRWAALQLAGKKYQSDTPPAEVHLDLRASPRITLTNLVRSSEAYTAHRLCAECAAILTTPGEPPMTDEQWDAFRAHYGGAGHGHS
jgi:hypothetical protein